MSRNGALVVENDLSLPDIWVGLHANADAWMRAGAAPDGQRQRLRIDESDRALLGALSVVEAERWRTFAEASGWTVYSAIAGAWCQNAELTPLANHWLAAAGQFRPGDHASRAARFLPDHLAPTDPRLSTLGRAPSIPLVCLAVLAARDVVCDVGPAELNVAPAPVRQALLAARIDLPGDVKKAWSAAAA